jgi:D-threo-aldose 1-dehydrogenase
VEPRHPVLRYGSALRVGARGGAARTGPRRPAARGVREFRGAPPLEAVFDFSAEGIRRSLAGSLERLGLDAVDLLLLHDPEEHMEEARRAIETMRELAPRVGVGTNVAETAVTFVERGDAEVVLLAGRYTLLDRSAEDELLPLCLERGVELLAAGVFNSGVLAGGAMFDYRVAPPAVLELRRRLDDACARHDVPLAAAAVQFPLRHPGVTSIVVGARTPEEIAEDIRLLDHPVPEELWRELASIV